MRKEAPPGSRLNQADLFYWACECSTGLTVEIFQTYAVITLTAEPEVAWLVRDGQPIPTHLVFLILTMFFVENFTPGEPQVQPGPGAA